ncbi:MAG TPA: hypothetical protein VFA70_15205 [Dehalococcoidia bacterium]|jgi:hypothetical protein|nr:hypothetical protein [Dehalococcoidia bacterium]
MVVPDGEPAPRGRICFDVDDTLINWRLQARPFAREVIAELHRSGFEIHIWSGVGRRWDVIDRLDLRPFVSGCHTKPLYRHRERLAEHGIQFVPDYVIDDYAEVVEAFGGWWIPPPAHPIEDDRRLLDVLYDIQRHFGLPQGFRNSALALQPYGASGDGRWLEARPAPT